MLTKNTPKMCLIFISKLDSAEYFPVAQCMMYCWQNCLGVRPTRLQGQHQCYRHSVTLLSTILAVMLVAVPQLMALCAVKQSLEGHRDKSRTLPRSSSEMFV